MMRPKSSDRGEVDDRQMPGIGVDLDLGDMRARREGEVLRVVERGLVEPRLQLVDAGSCAARRRSARPRRASSRGRCRRRVNLPSLNSMSASAASSRCAAIFLPLAMTLSIALTIARAADRQRARAVGAHAERDLGGVAVHDLDRARSGCRAGRRRAARRSSRGPGRGCAMPVNTRDAAGRVHPHRRRLRTGRRGRRASRPRPRARCRRPRYRWRCRCRATCRAPPPPAGAPRSRRSRPPAAPSRSVVW